MAANTEDTTPMFNKMATNYEESFPHMFDFAQESLTLAPPVDSTSHVHDNACGPGIVTRAILELFPSARIDATDISEGMVGATKVRYGTSDGRVTAQVMDVLDLSGFEDDRFTHSFSNFVFVILKPDEVRKGAREIYRTLQPGGTAVVVGWEQVGWKYDFLLPILRKVAEENGRDMTSVVETLKEVPAAQFEKAARETGCTDVKVGYMTRPLSGRELAKDSLRPVFGFFVGSVAKEWTEEERGKVLDLVEQGLGQQKEKPSTFEMRTWTVIFRK